MTFFLGFKKNKHFIFHFWSVHKRRGDCKWVKKIMWVFRNKKLKKKGPVFVTYLWLTFSPLFTLTGKWWTVCEQRWQGPSVGTRRRWLVDSGAEWDKWTGARKLPGQNLKYALGQMCKKNHTKAPTHVS